MNLHLKHKYLKYFYNKSDLYVYCRVGKCGSTSLTYALEGRESTNSPIIQPFSSKIAQFHLQKVIFKSQAKYIFIVRNPISRSLASFYHNPNLPIVKKYKNFNRFCELLCRNGDLNKEAIDDFFKHKQLKKGIHYHLSNIIDRVQSHQVSQIFTQEFLNQEIREILGINWQETVRPSNRLEHIDDLSIKAKQNIRKFLKKEYECINKLNKLKPIASHKLEKLLV